MNITTTSELAFSASASEKGLPSIVVREKVGAAAPMLGAGLSAMAEPAARQTRQRAAARAERTFIANISLTHPQDADGEKNSPSVGPSPNPDRAEPDPRPGRAAAGLPDRTSTRTGRPR